MNRREARVDWLAVAICSALFFTLSAVQAAPVEINVASAYAADNFQTQNLRDKKIFTAFDADTRKKLLDAANVAETRGWKLSQDSDKNFENQLVANKIDVSTMDFVIRSYLDRIGENLAREWLKKAGNEELNVLLKYTTDRSMK